MAFAYKGKIDRLCQEVSVTQNVINQAYLEMLGRERFDELTQVSQRVLVPECFFDDVNILAKQLNQQVPDSFKLTPGFCLDVNSQKTRFLGKPKSFTACPLFYLSEEAIKNTGYYDPQQYPQIHLHYLPSYVHEFNHYVQQVLQKPSESAVRQLLMGDYFHNEIKTLEDFDRVAKEIGEEELSSFQKSLKMKIEIASFLSDYYFELGTRLMDRLILRRVGVEITLPWRNIRQSFYRTSIKGIDEQFYLPGLGDPFYGVEDLEVVNRLINWQDNFRLPFKDPLNHQFTCSKKIPLEMISMDEYNQRFRNKN